MTKVTLYTQPGCHLCEEARQALEAARRDYGFELEEFDIRTDRTIRNRYRERIPVVAIDGVERLELHVDDAVLGSLLSEAEDSKLAEANS